MQHQVCRGDHQMAVEESGTMQLTLNYNFRLIPAEGNETFATCKTGNSLVSFFSQRDLLDHSWTFSSLFYHRIVAIIQGCDMGM
jgi:hypothetical protein